MEKNIKKIFEDNYKKYFDNTYFINFLNCFFNEEEYLMLRLLKGSYKSGKNPDKLFLKDDILNIIIESYSGDKLSFALNNVSIDCKNFILKRFCNENKKKFEIFTIYINYMLYRQHIDYIQYIDDINYSRYVNSSHYMIDLQYMESRKYYVYYRNNVRKIKDNFLKSNYEILSAHIYCINFNIRCFPNWSKQFILRISKRRKKDIKFDEKFQEYRNHFDNKKGILQYLNEDQYLILKKFLNEIKKEY